MVSRDVKVLRSIAWVLEKLFPSLKWISLTECVEEFNELLKGQVGHYPEKYNHTLDDDLWKYLDNKAIFSFKN